MSCVGFEPTIPASERAKTLQALDRLAIVTGAVHKPTQNLAATWVSDLSVYCLAMGLYVTLVMKWFCVNALQELEDRS
jgi:hypothetical protein